MDKEFVFEENDAEGLHTLEAISKAHRFNRWMYEQVAPFMQGRILEIGSGIGNISAFFKESGSDITLSDIRSLYCETLRNRFTGSVVEQLDLVHPDFHNRYRHLIGAFDSAFALNVIEHINDDGLAMRNLSSLLKPGGLVLILVPAGPALYNQIDRGLAHFRRYTVKSLRQLMLQSGFTPQRSWMFNALGIPAWITGGWVLRNREIGGGQMNAYEKLVPLARLIDKCTFHRLGLSVIVVASR